MHSGFSNLRSALPMNVKARYPGFKVWHGAQADIDRVTTIWRECLADHGGPYLFGASPAWRTRCSRRSARASYTYDVKLGDVEAAYCKTILAMPFMQEWIAAAKSEPEELEELDVEF